MPRSLIAGNWKLNGNLALCRAFSSAFDQLPDSVDVLVCPPAAYLHAFSSGNGCLKLGAQNVAQLSEGALTGEISANMLRELGCEFAIVGHSERRTLFGESNEQVLAKIEQLLAVGICPIVCVGENLEQREGGDTLAWVLAQLQSFLEPLSAEQVASLVIAYEPIWAIGTGKTASPEQAQEVHAAIRAELRKFCGASAEDVRLLYGGSVNAANAAKLLAMQDINGALVGGASLKADEFGAIVTAALAAQ